MSELFEPAALKEDDPTPKRVDEEGREVRDCVVCGAPFSVTHGRQSRCPEHREGHSKKGRSDAAPAAAKGRTAGDKLAPKLTGFIATVGVFIAPINQADGVAIIGGAEGLGTALGHLADENPSVRRALEKMVTVTAWGEVAAAASVIALPILVNHGVIGEIPAGLGGLPGSPAPGSPPPGPAGYTVPMGPNGHPGP